LIAVMQTSDAARITGSEVTARGRPPPASETAAAGRSATEALTLDDFTSAPLAFARGVCLMSFTLSEKRHTRRPTDRCKVLESCLAIRSTPAHG